MIALVLLAAGRAARFGGGKLAAPLAGRTVIEHTMAALGDARFGARLAVIGPDCPPTPGYLRIALDPPGAPQSRSVALGVAAARDLGASAVMIALADMPLVPPWHIAALLDRFDGDRLASRGAHGVMPPALVGAGRFAALTDLAGDRGAGMLLRDAPMLPLPDHAAIDIDTPDDLARAAALCAAGQITWLSTK